MAKARPLIGQRDATEIAQWEEANPASDLLSAKGIAFEDSSTVQIYKDGDDLKFKDDTVTTAVTLDDLLNSGGGSSSDVTATFEFYDDFVGQHPNNDDGSWDSDESGSGTVDLSTAITNKRPGVLVFDTGSDDDGYVSLARTDVATGIKLGGGELVYQCGIKIDTLYSGSQPFSVRVGLGDNDDEDDFTNGLAIVYDGSTDTKWLGMCSSSGSNSTTQGVTVDTNWHDFKIVVNAGATSVEFFMDGTSMGTVTSNIPTALLDLIFKIQKDGAGTSSRSFFLDYVYTSISFTGGSR